MGVDELDVGLDGCVACLWRWESEKRERGVMGTGGGVEVLVMILRKEIESTGVRNYFFGGYW